MKLGDYQLSRLHSITANLASSKDQRIVLVLFKTLEPQRELLWFFFQKVQRNILKIRSESVLSKIDENLSILQWRISTCYLKCLQFEIISRALCVLISTEFLMRERRWALIEECSMRRSPIVSLHGLFAKKWNPMDANRCSRWALFCCRLIRQTIELMGTNHTIDDLRMFEHHKILYAQWIIREDSHCRSLRVSLMAIGSLSHYGWYNDRLADVLTSELLHLCECITQWMC